MTELDDLIGWHTVQVRPYLGGGSNGPRYGAPAALVCTVAEQSDTAVTAAGNITTTRTSIAFDVDRKALIPQGSLVTLPGGTEREVTSVVIPDAPEPFTGLVVGIAEVT